MIVIYITRAFRGKSVGFSPIFFHSNLKNGAILRNIEQYKDFMEIKVQ